jgi:hypothetical protein
MNNKIEDFKVKRIIHTIGLNNNLTDEQVKEIIESQFRFTYQEIKKLKLEGLSDEEMDNLKTTFYYKYIGKLYTDNKIIKGHENRLNYLNNQIRKKNGRKEES